MSGPIPREIRHLVHLERLGLSASEHNQSTTGRMGINGSIPPEIGELRSLKKLWLQRTRISGPIPPEIAKLQNLTHLYLFATDISGSIPEEVSGRREGALSTPPRFHRMFHRCTCNPASRLISVRSATWRASSTFT